jgi:hypothetical protein
LRSVGRLGFILLGIYLACSTLAFSFKFFPTQASYEIWEIIFYFSIALLGALLFGVLPGIYLVRRSESLANRIFPEEANPLPPVESLLTAGIGVLGIWLAISNAIYLAGSLVGFVTSFRVDSISWIEQVAPIAENILGVSVGVAIYYWAPRIVQFANRAR